MKFDLKNGTTYFQSLISPSFDELHFSTIVHMNHMEHMFQDLPFYCTKKVPKNHNNFFHFRHGVELTSLLSWLHLFYTLRTLSFSQFYSKSSNRTGQAALNWARLNNVQQCTMYWVHPLYYVQCTLSNVKYTRLPAHWTQNLQCIVNFLSYTKLHPQKTEYSVQCAM